MDGKSCLFLKQTICFLALALAIAMLGFYFPAMAAEEKTSQNSGWEFAVAPYMWFLSLDGDVTVKGNESDLDLSFSDIWDELNIAAMLTFDARKGKWGIFGDMIGANLGKSETVDGIDIDPTVKLALLTGGGSYQLGKWKLSNAAGQAVPVVSIDALAGVRYTYLDVDIDLKGVGDTSGDQDWFDPLIGARAFFDLSEHWTLALEGNVGGFGIGSDFTWGALGTLGYRFRLFSESNNARMAGGYRAIYQDYADGSGTDKFEWDVTYHGPILGLEIDF